MSDTTVRIGDSEVPAIEYFRPGYVEDNKAGERIPRDSVHGLAHVHRVLLAKNMLNPTAHRYFLANALVEGTIYFGVFNATQEPEVQQRLAELGHAPFRAPLINSSTLASYAIAAAYEYGVCFDYKTGAYTDRVFGSSASEMQRLIVWNGTGTASLGSGKTTTGQNHATKVRSMLSYLAVPANAPLVHYYMSRGGINPISGQLIQPQ
jgi:hypothetical protein